MTDLLTTDNADSGEVVRLHEAIVETDVLDAREIVQPTRSLTGYAKSLPPLRGLRRPDATGEHPIYRPPNFDAALNKPPVGKVPPCVCGATVKPLLGRGKRRRPRAMWAWLLVRVGTDLLALAGIAAVALAVWR